MSGGKRATAEQAFIGEVDYDEEAGGLPSDQCFITLSPNATLKRGVFVMIGQGPSYFIAQIVDGPYYTTAKGSSSLHPLVKAQYTAELWAYIDRGEKKTVLSRPIPGTGVTPLEIGEAQDFLGISGGMFLGGLATDKRVGIRIRSSSLARHVGIFGTTGGGKSNTIQVLMEEVCTEGFSILVFDVEGEYIQMDKPTEKLLHLLDDFKLKPAGVKDLRVYVPNPCDSGREDATRFGIKFKDVDEEIFAEASELNRMEQLYFEDLIEKVNAVLPISKTITLDAVIDRLLNRLHAQAGNAVMPPFIAEAHTTLYSKLHLVSNLNLVDVKAKSLNIEEIFKPGRISVVDFSDATDNVRNLIIADLLHKCFKYKIAHMQSSKLLIVIEEAHNFISRERRERMLATLLLIVEIARRGRKRGLYLGIVTQQPNHLPGEILELCNTRIMHRMSSPANINVLKESTGKVPEGLWNTVPSLNTGESIVSTPAYLRALSVMVRPVQSTRLVQE